MRARWPSGALLFRAPAWWGGGWPRKLFEAVEAPTRSGMVTIRRIHDGHIGYVWFDRPQKFPTALSDHARAFLSLARRRA